MLDVFKLNCASGFVSGLLWTSYIEIKEVRQFFMKYLKINILFEQILHVYFEQPCSLA